MGINSININNDLSPVINYSNAGFVYANGDDKLLAGAATSLLTDHKLRQDMGKNSRALLLREFSVESAVTNILKSVKRG